MIKQSTDRTAQRYDAELYEQSLPVFINPYMTYSLARFLPRCSTLPTPLINAGVQMRCLLLRFYTSFPVVLKCAAGLPVVRHVVVSPICVLLNNSYPQPSRYTDYAIPSPRLNKVSMRSNRHFFHNGRHNTAIHCCHLVVLRQATQIRLASTKHAKNCETSPQKNNALLK